MTDDKSCCHTPAHTEKMSAACDMPPSSTAQKTDWFTYKPLIVILGMALVGAGALSYGGLLPFMNGLMGLFLLFLATLKLFDLNGFAKSFAQYDPLATQMPVYGQVYPFIELLLGALYLAVLYPLFTNLLLIIILAVSTAGIIKSLQTGKSLQCGCVGTGFNLPLEKVTVFENSVMILMALFMILNVI